MKFIINQDKLNKYLVFVSKAVPSRPNHPILANILLDATSEKQKVNLSGFDLSMAIKAEIDAEVKEGGQMLLPSKLLTEIISKLVGDILFESKGDIIKIKSGGSKYQIQGMTAIEEYPELETINDKSTEIEISGDTFLKGLKGTLFASSQDETKQILTGINLIVDRVGLHFAATDGHRLSYVLIENFDDEKDEPSSLTIPSKALREVKQMIVTDDNLKLEFDDCKILFDMGDIKLHCLKMEGVFPSYQQLIPKSFNILINVDRRNFIGSLERVSIVSNCNNGIATCTVDTENQMVGISAIASDVGNANESLPAQITGDSLAFAFNVKYLLEGLKTINSTEIQFSLISNTSPFTVSPLGGDIKSTYLVMPVQLRN